jgi:hypothetical protein
MINNNNTTIDFKQYGQVITGNIIESQEIINPPILHPDMKVPFYPLDFWHQKEVNISMVVNAFSDYELLQQIINNSLNEIEGLNISYDSCYCLWTIEYGTKPLEETVSPDLIARVKLGRVVAILAATIAYEKFPHNLDNYEDDDDDYTDDDEFKNLYTINKWCKMEICVIYDLVDDTFIIQPNRIKGDHSAFYFVSIKVKNAVNNNENILWLIRKNYVELLEDIQYGHNSGDHIMKYLLNDLICKEVCSFMSL